MKQRRALFYVPAFAALVAPLAALPAPILMARAPNGETVTLHDDAGPCVGEALMVVWRSADAKRSIPGCYVVHGDAVHIVYFDADKGLIGRANFRRVKDS